MMALHYTGPITDAINTHCPWSGKPVDADSLVIINNIIIGFCNTGCRDKFIAAPMDYPDVIAMLKPS